MSFKITSLAAALALTGSLLASDPIKLLSDGTGDKVDKTIQNGNKVEKARRISARTMSEQGSNYRNWTVFRASREKTSAKYIYRERETGDTGSETTGKPKGVIIEFPEGEKETGYAFFTGRLTPGSYNITFTEGNIGKVGVRLIDKQGETIDEDGNRCKVSFKTGPVFTLKIPENTNGDITLFLRPNVPNLIHDPNFKSKLLFEDFKVTPIEEAK